MQIKAQRRVSSETFEKFCPLIHVRTSADAISYSCRSVRFKFTFRRKHKQ